MLHESVSTPDKTPVWHSYPPQNVLEEFKTGIVGFSLSEAQLRLEQYGENRLKSPKPQSIVIRFLLQFHNLLISLLLAACSMTAFLGHWVDSGVILGVVISGYRCQLINWCLAIS